MQPCSEAQRDADQMKQIIFVACLMLVVGACARTGNGGVGALRRATAGADRPMLAVWRDSDGNTYAPRLRVAIWNDGRILFSKDAPRWGTNLFLGKLRPADVVSLKERVRAMGVLDLSRNSYLRPDEPWCCLLLDFGEQKQMLYWDEEELVWYWNEGQPMHGTLPKGDFKRSWVQVNLLALSLAPKDATRVEEGFRGALSSWYIKQPSQEESSQKLR